MSDREIYSKPREWRGVQFSEESVAGTSGEKIDVIPRSIVQHIVLKYGFEAQHPLMQAVAGIVVSCGAIAIPTYYYIVAMRGGWLLLAEPVFFLVIAVFGINLTYKALRRGFYLDIIFEGGSRKLRFRNRPKLRDVENFLSLAEKTFDYTIDRSAGTTEFPSKIS